MKNQLALFVCFLFTVFIFSCKTKKNIEQEVHLCETTDTTTTSVATENLYDEIVTKDTIEAISNQMREAFKNRRTLSYDEQEVENYFNENLNM